jgi:hypothetical protein
VIDQELDYVETAILPSDGGWRRDCRMSSPLTLTDLKAEAAAFSVIESQHFEKSLFGVTDGKAVGTYLEHKFQSYLAGRYSYDRGNSARGIDFPSLGVNIKVTSIRQPQSSCPFKSAGQKIFGLGYSLLVFVYEKLDDNKRKAGRLDLQHTIFVEADRTADWQTTYGLLRLIENQGNLDDVLAFFRERMLPVDDIEAQALAEQVLREPPKLGYLTVSNALQWRLQYRRVIEQAGHVDGIARLS